MATHAKPVSPVLDRTVAYLSACLSWLSAWDLRPGRHRLLGLPEIGADEEYATELHAMRTPVWPTEDDLAAVSGRCGVHGRDEPCFECNVAHQPTEKFGAVTA